MLPCPRRRNHDKFDTLQIDLDRDGVADVFYRGWAWNAPCPEMPDMELRSRLTADHEYNFWFNKHDDGNGGTVFIEIYGDTTKLRPGNEVSVRFDKIYVEDALMVPRTAVKSDKKGSYLNVYVNGFSSKRYVVIGGADGTRNWIVSGVEEGDVIILD